MYERIVVGVDGSAGSARALAWATRFSQATNAEIVAVYCFSDSPMLGEATNAGLLEDHRRLLEDDWTRALHDSGVPYRTRVEQGDPRVRLLAVVDEERSDLIVVGSRGHGGVSELLLGSVAQWITHHARIPVVVVPATASEPSERSGDPEAQRGASGSKGPLPI